MRWRWTPRRRAPRRNTSPRRASRSGWLRSSRLLLLVGVLDPTEYDEVQLVEERQIGVLSQLSIGDGHMNVTQRIRE